MATSPPVERPTLLGCPVDVLTLPETVDRIIAMIHEGGYHSQFSLNAAKIVEARRSSDLRGFLQRASIVNADGQSLVWAGKLLGVRLPERVAGIDLLGALLAAMEREGLSAYFLGAREDVIARAASRIAARHPRLHIAGFHHGHFPPEDDERVAASIAESAPDALFVGMSSPRKEYWIDARQAATGARFAMGVGGSFDVIAGRHQAGAAADSTAGARMGLPHRPGAPPARPALRVHERSVPEARRRGVRPQPPHAGSSSIVRASNAGRAKIVYVVGARPNFVKMAPVIAALRDRLPEAGHVIVHTGQHYDAAMSDIFIGQLGIPEPDHLLGVGSGTHAQQTARVMERLEPVLEAERPDLVIVPGDVNSTLAASLVAVKLGIPTAHLEAGLRSFDRSMPEEINRIVADAFADVLLAHSDEALANLDREGIDPTRIHLVGNTMIDSLVACETRFRALHAAESLGLAPRRVRARHLAPAGARRRPSARRGHGRAGDPLRACCPSSSRSTRERGPASTSAALEGRLTLLDPLGYLEFLSLEADAGAVLTDSGGVQEEASYLGVPCFTLRDTTERPVTVRLGTNTLLGLDPEAIGRVAIRPGGTPPSIPGWDGRAAERVAATVEQFLAGALSPPTPLPRSG